MDKKDFLSKIYESNYSYLVHIESFRNKIILIFITLIGILHSSILIKHVPEIIIDRASISFILFIIGIIILIFLLLQKSNYNKCYKDNLNIQKYILDRHEDLLEVKSDDTKKSLIKKPFTYLVLFQIILTISTTLYFFDALKDLIKKLIEIIIKECNIILVVILIMSLLLNVVLIILRSKEKKIAK